VKKFFFLLLLFFVVSAQALSISISQFGFLKGEELIIRGDCDANVSIQGHLVEKEIFSATAECRNGAYVHREPVSFLVPTGELSITASEESFSESKSALVRPTRESAFLTISVGSPSQREVNRTENVVVSVSVSDAGKPVENAVVQSWDPSGKPFRLDSTAPGIYSAEVAIPFDAALKPWNIIVVAEAQGAQGTVGGEQSFSVPLVQAPIVLEVESPTGQNLSSLQKVLFRVKARYQNGSPLENPVVFLQRNDQNIALESREPGIFETTQTFSSKELGLQKIAFFAMDSAQNRAGKELEFFVTEDFQSQFVTMLPYLLSIGVLIALVALVVVPRIRKQKNEKGMLKRKKEVEQELAVLQKQYFEQNAMNKDAFGQKMVALEQELDEINKKLNTLKK